MKITAWAKNYEFDLVQAINLGLVKEIPPRPRIKVGNKYRHKITGLIYLLICSSLNRVNLVNIDSGHRQAFDGVSVNDINDITDVEFNTILSGAINPQNLVLVDVVFTVKS